MIAASESVLVKRAIGEALESLAQELETRAGNALYRAAWKVAAKIVRARKPE